MIGLSPIHVNSHCPRAAFTEFTPACCHLPRDLVPFLLKEPNDLMYAKLGLHFACTKRVGEVLLRQGRQP